MTNLPLTSNHWGVYRVEAENNQVKALHGFEEDKDVSPIGQGILDVLDAPSRIKTPMVRKSWLESGPGSAVENRGRDPFVSVSWDTAEKLVADELTRIKNHYGNQSIYGGSYGWASAGRFHHAQSQIHRFLNCIGGYTRSKNTYSFAAAEVIMPHVMGNMFDLLVDSTSWPSVIENTELLVAFGGIPLKNGQINSGGVGCHVQREHLQSASQAGVEFVNVSPLRDDIDAMVNSTWLAIRPSTDAALLLALCHTLLIDNLYDMEFVKNHCVGFETLQSYLSGKEDGVEKSAEWAAAICAIDSTAIRQLARNMASKRSMLSISWSMSRQDHGEQVFWAGVTLAAMLGQIGLPGGGICFGYSATNSIGDHRTKIPGASLPQGKNPINSFIPVARISDMLLNPGQAFDYDGTQYTYPDIHCVYWAGGNPFHHHQDINRMLKAWQQVESIVVHDWCWNSMAKHADIVLPCTTGLERNDIAISPRDPYMVKMQKAQEPVGESRNDYDIFAGIARNMGAEAAFTEGRTEADWLQWIYQTTLEKSAEQGIELPGYERFCATGWFKPEAPETPNIMLKAFREDPQANPLPTPSGKLELYSQTIAAFDYDDCAGHACWYEPVEWLGGDASDYPLHLISNQPITKLHAQLDHGSVSRAAKIKQREPIRMHSQEAALRGLATNDVVRVFNQRGACLAGVITDDKVMLGVVQMATGAWYDPLEPGRIGSLCKHGSVNVLTVDKGSSNLGQGPIAHTCLVEVELFKEELPDVTAFDPPVILEN